MRFEHLLKRFWYFFWFIALPLAAAWMAVDILDRLEIIEEIEIWYVLLLFALLAFAIYSIRNKLPYWQDRDENSPYNRRRRRKEARIMLKDVRKIVARKAGRISEHGKSEMLAAQEGVAKALDSGDDEKLSAAVKKLDEKFNRHLAFARKSAGREYFESVGVAVLVALLLRIFVVEAFKIPSESMVPTLMVGDHIFVSKYRYGLSVPFHKKRLVRFARPSYGEVIVFIKPSVEEQTGVPAGDLVFEDEYEMVGKDFIKRIVGLPGDTISMEDDVLYVNGKKVPRCRIGTQTYRTLSHTENRWSDHEADLWVEKHGEYVYTVIEEKYGAGASFGPAKVPADQVFVMGDNRDNSNDSRYWGAVPFDNIKGRAMFIWWSNRRPHGFQWDRVGTLIMERPGLDAEKTAALERCQGFEVE